MASIFSASEIPYETTARLVIWPPSHPLPNYDGSLRSCIRKALEYARYEPPPHWVEIVIDGFDIIGWDDIQKLSLRDDYLRNLFKKLIKAKG